MELRVWVEGIPRVVCGISEVTTCQEVVVALAHAIGKTGRYNLIEKWRDTERLLAPADSPIKSLHKWGEYAPDVQYVLRRTADKHRRRNNQVSAASSDQRDVGSHPEIIKRPAHCTNIKRNLTFSGAHSCSSSSPPLQVTKGHGKSSSHDNSSLESLEEQSSFAESHSSTSTSPYASFEGKRPQPDLLGHSYNSIERNRHLYNMQYSTSSAGSSPQETPVNSLGRKHQNRPSPLVSNSNSAKDKRQSDKNRNNHSNQLPDDPDQRSTFKNTGKQVSHSKETCSNNNTAFQDSNDLAYHKRTNWISSSPTSSLSATSSSPVSNMQPATPPRSRHRPHHNMDKKHKAVANSMQKHHTDGGGSKCLDADVELYAALADVGRDELLKLLNLQLERLAQQDSHMKSLEKEIIELEKKHDSCSDCDQPSFSEELTALEAADQELESHIEELELVSWEDKLQMETTRCDCLKEELAQMRSKLTTCEKNLNDQRQQLTKLSENMEKETAEIKKEQDAKNHEIRLLQEIEELKRQIAEKTAECGASEMQVTELGEEVKQMDSLIEDRRLEERHLERQLADVNLDEFQDTPPVDMKTDVDKFAPFLTSANRPGSARKILYNPLALKEAMSAGSDDPCWV